MTLAHPIDGSPGAWDLDLPVLALSLTLVVAYARGVGRLAERRSARTPSRGNRSFFYLGVFVATAAIVTPLHGWSETLFSAHMTQHLLLILVAAPLVVLGRPTAPLIAALPTKVGKATARVIVRIRRRAGLILHPISLWALHAFVLWAWHLPTVYELALENSVLHGLEHATFFGTAVLLWAAVAGERRLGEGPSVLLLFGTGLQSAALGALLAFSATALYEPHLAAARAAGFDPLTDQQLAGVIMWIPPGLVYLIVCAAMLARLLQDDAGIGEAGRP